MKINTNAKSNNRERFVKSVVGKGAKRKKEVSIRLNKSGLSADGAQRWVVCARFTPEARPKISSTDWCVPELDREAKRLYFVTATEEEGYKLTASRAVNTYKSISFSVPDVEEWRKFEGLYDLKKDVAENLYYIDLPN